MDHGFGARLRAERERRKISLDSIAATSKVSISLFKALERGDVSRWPSGIYRRAFVRAYASAIGLDPEETLREFLEHFPDPDSALPETLAAPGTAHPAPGRPHSMPETRQDAPRTWHYTPGTPHSSPGIVLYLRLPHTRITDACVRWIASLFTWIGHLSSQSSSS
jgi:transcriptional regulator with XRE-family HTH domain